jgi:hypothetical protein
VEYDADELGTVDVLDFLSECGVGVSSVNAVRI